MQLLTSNLTSIDHKKSRHYKGMVRLLGGIEQVSVLKARYFVRLFTHAQIKKGRAYTYKQLRQMANPGADVEQFQAQMQDLAGKYVFLRGYNLECPHCALDYWYEGISEHVLCTGCRMNFQAPLEVDFAYNLNPLFAEGLNQGALSVLLTVFWLQSQSETPIDWDAGYQINGADIDLIADCDGQLIMAECKDNVRHSSKQQLERLLATAHELKARCIFATLSHEAAAVPGVEILTAHHLLFS